MRSKTMLHFLGACLPTKQDINQTSEESEYDVEEKYGSEAKSSPLTLEVVQLVTTINLIPLSGPL